MVLLVGETCIYLWAVNQTGSLMDVRAGLQSPASRCFGAGWSPGMQTKDESAL